MTVQRSIWKPNFPIWPSLPCPSCKVGTLKIDRKSISKEETVSSKRRDQHIHPDYIYQRFIAILACTNPSCGDRVFVCGEIEPRLDHAFTSDGEPTGEVFEFYAPRFFEPAPPIFPIPKKCPKRVRDELIRAFALIWSDVGSAGNRLRVAVEALMNEQKVQKKAKIQTGRNRGKFRELTLDERIKKFGEKQEIAATQFLAIKWLGNIGSHADLAVLTRDDILDAFEHFDYALDLVYVNKGVVLAKRAKHIIKKKGSVRAKPKRIRR